ncbi:iron ABC transporter ATP-binding protein [Steroidobacter denitrificans]|uniref:Iron ABC transporter ATP-binding protein n=1 Tax=Steroidobacter denitrificans TaxID=465721 RepID=A0A127FE74_STEDE|nr:ATP-binding cassette domain-containing protein [Steroidobacter denitrificans]AMN48200.1 iron ABC transporter ATP-binding protein [Steroidobacter denitrificans]
MDHPPLVSVRSLVNRFGAQLVHDQIDLDVHPGEVLGIVGGSGSGKSVLLRTMLGLHRPTAGQVLIAGKDITLMSESEMLAVKRSYGVTFQQGALFSSLTVAENIQLPIREYFDVSAQALASLTEMRLRMVGLPLEAGAKLPSQLSGGMVKRAALARSLALDPTLLFLDEPTAGLDPISASAFDELVRYLHRGLKLTIVMITHDLDTLIATCSRVAVLVDRKIVVDTLEGLVDNPHPWIREYFHGPRARAAHMAARAADEAQPCRGGDLRNPRRHR